MKKSCQHCGIVDFKHICPVALRAKNDRDAKREDKKIYWSREWRKFRVDVLEDQKYICLWSMYVEGVIDVANPVHHIVELIEDDSKAYDRDNVIGLSKAMHDKVHVLYKIDKVTTIKILKECNRLWGDGVRLEGLGVLKMMLKEIDTPLP